MSESILLSQLAENTVRGTLLILGMLAIRPVLRRYLGATSFHWMWLVVAARLLWPMELPSVLHVTVPERTVLSADVSEVRPEGGEDPKTTSVVTGEIIRTAYPGSSTLWFLAVWALGFVLVALFSWISGRRFHRQLKNRSRPAEKSVVQTAARLSAHLQMAVPLVVETPLVNSPAVTGLFRPKILLPLGIGRHLPVSQLEIVLLHELGHIKRRDLWHQAILRLAVTAHWFNPLVWLAANLSRVDRELACDEFVLSHASPSQSAIYDQTLFRLVELSRTCPRFPASAGMLETLKHLKYRIQMIQTYRPSTSFRFALSVLFLGLTALAMFFLSTESRAEGQRTGAAEKKASPVTVQIKYLEVEKADEENLLRPLVGSQLTGSQMNALLAALEKNGRTDVLSAPSVIAIPGQEATVRIGSEIPYRTKLAEGRGQETNKTLQLGISTAILVKSVSETGTSAVSLATRKLDLQGWKVLNGAESGTVIQQKQPPTGKAVAAVTTERKSSADVDLSPGSWALLAVGSNEDGKSLWLMVSLQDPSVHISGDKTWTSEGIANAAGSVEISHRDAFMRADRAAYHLETKRLNLDGKVQYTGPLGDQRAEKAVYEIETGKFVVERRDSVSAGGRLPYGRPVAGKPGYVESPYVTNKGFIDVRGFADDAEVQDPFTGKMFLVPALNSDESFLEVPVSLNLKDMPLAEAIRTVGELAGVKVHVDASVGTTRTTTNFQGASAREIFEYLAKSGGVTLSVVDGTVVFRGAKDRPVSETERYDNPLGKKYALDIGKAGTRFRF